MFAMSGGGIMTRHRTTIACIVLAALLGSAPGLDSSAHEQDATAAGVRERLDRGEYRQSEALARELLSEAEGDDGTDSLEAGRVLVLLVTARLGQGVWPDAELRDQAERAVRILEERLGERDGEVAEGLLLLAVMARRLDGYQMAMPLYEQALSIAESAYGSEHPLTARIMASFAWAKRDAGQTTEAIEYLQQARAIQERELGRGHPHTISSKCGLAYMFGYHQGKWKDAVEILEAELVFLEESYGPHHVLLSPVLNNLGNFYINQGRNKLAGTVYERARVIAEKEYGDENVSVANSLLGLAIVCRNTEQWERSRQLFEQVIGMFERTRGPYDQKLGSVMFSAGRLYEITGDYIAARDAYERSLAIAEVAYGPEHIYYGWGLARYANLLLRLGDLDAARAACIEAAGISENSSPRNPQMLGNALGVLSLVQFEEGDLEGALETVRRVLRIFEEAGYGSDIASVLEARSLVARIAAERGRLAEAQDALEENLEAHERLLGADHLYVANVLQQLAGVVARRGDDERAIALIKRALAIREQALGSDHLRVGWSLVPLARLLARNGRVGEALDAALRAERISRDHLRLTAMSLPERQALGFAGVRTSGLNVALSVASEAPPADKTISQVWRELAASRALVLDELASRHRAVRDRSDPEISKLAAELTAARAALANLMVRGSEKRAPEQYRALLEFARQRTDRAEQALAAKSTAFRQSRPLEELDLSRVRALLPERSALLSYVRYFQHPIGRGDGRRAGKTAVADSGTGWQYAALVVEPDRRDASFISLGPAATIDNLVGAWRAEVGNMPGALAAAARAAESRYIDVGTDLRRAIWDPVVKGVEDYRQLFVVPAGTINLVNLATLPTENGRYLVESGPVLHHLSAERDLIQTRAGKTGNGLLALGGVDFDADLSAPPEPATQLADAGSVASTTPVSARLFRGSLSGCEEFRELHFEPLPGTVKEIDEVSAAWSRGARVGDGGKAPVLRLTGRRASEAAIKLHAGDCEVLHLASHGFFLDGRCPSSIEGEERSFGSPIRGDGAYMSGSRENPLRLSGIVLAGANRRNTAPEDQEDGILTAEEIASLDLSGVVWAVLSTCESGAGEVLRGEGVLGLRRAFQIAGARTLIMSLWPVQDETTRQWMRALYAARQEGMSTADSVRQASLDLLANRRESGLSAHPFYWGAFVAAGDWR